MLENEIANQCKICTQNSDVFLYIQEINRQGHTQAFMHVTGHTSAKIKGLEKDLKTLFHLIDWTCDASHEKILSNCS